MNKCGIAATEKIDDMLKSISIESCAATEQRKQLICKAKKNILTLLKYASNACGDLEFTLRFMFDHDYFAIHKTWLLAPTATCRMGNNQDLKLASILADRIKKMLEPICESNEHNNFYVYFTSVYNGRFKKYRLARFFMRPKIEYNFTMINERH